MTVMNPAADANQQGKECNNALDSFSFNHGWVYDTINVGCNNHPGIYAGPKDIRHSHLLLKTPH